MENEFGSIREQRHKERQKVYQDKRWKTLRTLKVQNNPLCEQCLKEGKITPTQDVHHLKSPFVRGLSPQEKDKRAYDYDNLMSLCKEHHYKIHHPEGIEMSMEEKILKYQ